MSKIPNLPDVQTFVYYFSDISPYLGPQLLLQQVIKLLLSPVLSFWVVGVTTMIKANHSSDELANLK